MKYPNHQKPVHKAAIIPPANPPVSVTSPLTDEPVDTRTFQEPPTPPPSSFWFGDDEEDFPRTVGRYTLRSKLGEGGMGTVYLAHDTRLDIPVALKVPKEALLYYPGAIERFYSEARTLARLHHPNLCRVFDVGDIEGKHYLSMAYVEGEPLSKLTGRPHTEVADIVRSVALALAEAHREGVIHRDIKSANIVYHKRGQPVVIDFGLALPVGEPGKQHVAGTLQYMAPEQLCGAATLASDVYSLGVVLYELITGTLPFLARQQRALVGMILDEDLAAPAPMTISSALDGSLDAIIRKAMAKRIGERFPSMDSFAAALTEYLKPKAKPSEVAINMNTVSARPAVELGTVSRSAIAFEFEGYGAIAPSTMEQQDRLYLDVGNRLGPGVLDHHHQEGDGSSTARLVLDHPEWVDLAVKPWRQADDPFVIVLHEYPDLDGLVSSYLAMRRLTRSELPAAAERLVDYVGKVDAGEIGMSLANPFSLYCACLHLAQRHRQSGWPSRQEEWFAAVADSLRVIEFVAEEAANAGANIEDIDAFRTPGLFRPMDRKEIETDIERYRSTLANPISLARHTVLTLPSEDGQRRSVDTLLIRQQQSSDDPDRCVFLKDWARSDAELCPASGGYIGLSVFHEESQSQVRRCILSVRPGEGVSLRGLGRTLDELEAKRRIEKYGVDDRVIDPTTRTPKEARPGYANSDPWYDGRAHGYTIVDSPRSGTLLTADEIEEMFLAFGETTMSSCRPL